MAFLGKSTSNSFTIGDNDYDIIVQLDAAHRRDINDVANLRVSNTEGKFVRLGDVADVYFSSVLHVLTVRTDSARSLFMLIQSVLLQAI